MADVHSAARKPQMYKDDKGKMRVRMVPSKQDVKTEKILTPAEKRGRERIAKKLPMKDFKKRYGDDAMAVKMATATNIAKKKYEGDNETAGVEETKGAPKGYHFTRSGKLRKGDADVDGPGGKKLRADPLDKQRSKIPPLPEAVTYHGNPNKDDDARNAARRRALARQDNLLRKRKAEKEKQESMSVPVRRDVPASTDDIAKAKKAISQGMPRHKAQAKYLVKSTDLQKKTQSYGDLLKYGRKDEQVEEHFNWKVSHAGKDVHVKAPHAGAAVKKAQKGFGNMDLTKAKITNLGKVGTPAKEEVEEVFAGHYSMPSKRQIGRASDEPNTGPRNTYRPRPSLSPRSLNKKLYGKAMGSTMKGEDTENVQELKKSTLGSYVKKAAQDAGAKAYSAAQKAMSNPDQSGKDYVKSVKRQKGIAMATDKLTREAVSKGADLGENNSAPQTAAHRRAMMVGVNRSNKVKLKGFGPDGAKGNMSSASARAALKPKAEGADKPPFEGPYTSTKEPRKDKFGNVVKKKNIASFLAKKGMKSASKTEAKVDEISTDLKKRYIDKAKSDYGHQQYSRAIAKDMGADKDVQKHYTRKMQKRLGGIGRATATMGESFDDQDHQLQEMMAYYTIYKDGKVVAKRVRAMSAKDAEEQAYMKMGSASKYSGAGRGSFKAVKESVEEANDKWERNFKKRIAMTVSGGKKVKDYMKTKVDQRKADHAKQDPGAVKGGLGPAVVDRQKAYKKAKEKGLRPGQIVMTRSSKQRKLPEETQLDEMKANAAYTKAAKDIKAYAAKDGGIDKKDMMNFAADLDLMGRAPNILQAGQILDRINKRFKGYDTDVRDRLSMYLKKHGLME